MYKNHFLLQPATWIGEGKIVFAGAKDPTKFFTRWFLISSSPGEMRWQQEVELHGLHQTNRNEFTIYDIQETHFKMILENESMGRVNGKGIMDEKTVAWELRDVPGYEGYEVYELQKNGEYAFRAEYISIDQLRSQIDGRICKKEA